MASEFLSLKLMQINEKTAQYLQKITDSVTEKVKQRVGKWSFDSPSSLSPLISSLKRYLNIPEKTRQTLLDKKSRDVYFAEEKKKQEEMSRKSLAWMKDQKKREKQKQKKIELLSKAIQEQEEIQKQVQTEAYNARKKEIHEQTLETMQKQKEKRFQERKELRQKQSASRFIVEKNPLFIRMEQQNSTDFKIDALKQRKEHLAKVRMLYSPGNYREHIHWYSNVKKQHDTPHVFGQCSSTFNSVAGSKLFEEDKRRMAQSHQEFLRRRELLQRSKEYAQEIKDTLMIEMPKKKPKKNETSKSYVNHKKEYNSNSQEWKPHKYPKNPMVPDPPPPPKEIKVTDYLAELKSRREEKPISSFSFENIEDSMPLNKRIEKIKMISRNVETDINHKEIEIQGTSHYQAIKKGEEINKMLVSSVKAKLSVLESMNNL